MNKHFSVINKRGVIAASILLLVNILIFGISLSMILSGGSKLWLISLIIFAVFFIISLMIMMSILTAGIDIKEGMVIMPDLDPSKGKQPKFRINRLQDVQLRDGQARQLAPSTDSLIGARIVFLLDDDTAEIYYPVSITAKQFEKIKSGMVALS